MAYASGNPATKKALREAIAAGERVRIHGAGPFEPTRDGVAFVEGPHFPEPHRWYARVEVVGGRIVKVLA